MIWKGWRPRTGKGQWFKGKVELSLLAVTGYGSMYLFFYPATHEFISKHATHEFISKQQF